jgi:C4-dicarboxylate-specific signal transduction histidine kinase
MLREPALFALLQSHPPTLWEGHRVPVVLFVVIGVAQLLLIGALAVALRRRRQAEAARQRAEARSAELRQALTHASRITLLGELTAALAHEINQPLAAILSNAQATKRWLAGDRPDLVEIRAIVDDIIADDKRAGAIIHRVRTLLKTAEPTHTEFDMVQAIREVAALLHGELIAANVTLRLDLADALIVHGDKVAMQQLLLNLMLNGIQSIQDAGVSVRQIQVEAQRVDGTARVVVHDTGSDVSEELRETLFETWFTGRAGGLEVDLAVCRRIAEAHGGHLDLRASVSGGTTFVLDLPSEVTTT